MAEKPEFLSATTIIGDRIINPAGQNLGKIENLMIHLEDGRIVYAVVAFGEDLGLRGKLFAIPWPMLTVDPERKCFVMEVSRELLKQAPGMDEDAWPRYTPSHDWLARIYKHYGYDVYW